MYYLILFSFLINLSVDTISLFAFYIGVLSYDVRDSRPDFRLYPFITINGDTPIEVLISELASNLAIRRRSS